MAFLAAEGTKNVIVHDDRMVAESNADEFALFWPLAMSSDGGTLAWSGNRKDRGEVFVNGRSLGSFREVRPVSVSAHGTTVAFFARRKPDAWFIVINGKEGPEYSEFAYDIAMSADGTTVVGVDPQEEFLQAGDRRWAMPSGLVKLHLSPDGRSIVFEKREPAPPRDRFLEGDGRRGPGFPVIEPPSFAPDGRSFTYGARREDRSFVVVGDRTFETPGRVGTPVFSPDGRRVGYGAQIGREIWWKVIPVE